MGRVSLVIAWVRDKLMDWLPMKWTFFTALVNINSEVRWSPKHGDL